MVRRSGRAVVLGAVVVGTALAGCGSGDDGGTSPTASGPGATERPGTTAPAPATTAGIASDGSGAVVGAHECVPPGAGDRGDATVPWERLANPVFALDHMTKDTTVRLVDGRWHLFASERFEDDEQADGQGHWASTDLSSWEPSGPARPWRSPEITRARDGRYVLTHQLPDPDDPELAKVFAATATDVDGEWSEPVRLVPDLFGDERLIDAALAHTERGLFLAFKRGRRDAIEQHVEIAWSPSGSLEGPWQHVGEPDLPWSENFEFLVIDGAWHVLVTQIPIHRPALYRLAGEPADPQSWLHWTEVGVFDVPAEDWNRGETPGITHETANSAYLCDARALDGHWYLFYAGSTELDTFAGRGHAKIGVARSTDLVTWEVPPGEA